MFGEVSDIVGADLAGHGVLHGSADVQAEKIESPAWLTLSPQKPQSIKGAR